jgi:hypothetical protein
VGVYSVTITALGDGDTFANSAESDRSNTRSITQRPRVTAPQEPNAQVIEWQENGLFRWRNPDGGLNPGGGGTPLVDYAIRVFTHAGSESSDSTQLGEPMNARRHSGQGIPTWTNFHLAYAGVPAQIGLFYSVTVTALGDDLLILDAEPSDHSARIEYTVFGNSRVWAMTRGTGTGAGENFVAGSEHGKIGWSSDGITWRLSDQNIFGNRTVRGIAHNGGSPGIFIIVGENGTAARSIDGGKTWTTKPPENGFGSTSILSITYGGTGSNARFVAAGDGGQVRRSNGTSWTNDANWHGNPPGTILDGQAVVGITFGADRFVAVGAGNTIGYSTDGIDWLFVRRLTNDDQVSPAESIAFGHDRFVVLLNGIGDAWNPNQQNDFASQTSANIHYPDAPNWQWGSTGASSWHDEGDNGWRKRDLAKVTFDGTRFLAVGSHIAGHTNNIAISTNGTTWTASQASEFGLDTNISAAISLGPGTNQFILSGNERNGNWGKMAIIER